MTLIGTTPYSHALTGRKARDEITKLLYRIGCTAVGFMDDFERHDVVLEFVHRERKIALRVSARGWAAMYLKTRPYSSTMHMPRADYEARALQQGQIAVNSILRDWVKGQITAIEAGIFSFDHVFLPFTLLPSGQTIAEQIEQMGLITQGHADANH